MKRVLIAGCGFVGTALGAALAAEGHVVWGLRRDPQRLPPSLRPLTADLTDPRSLERLPEGIDALVYAASPGERSDRAYAACYGQGLAHVLRALEQRGEQVERAVLTTSTAVYAQSDGEWVDESSPTEPEHFSGRRLLEGERVLRAGPFPGVVARLAGIYGPGRYGLLRRVYERTARCPARPRYTNRIHRDDCAAMLRHLLTLEDPAPVYLGVDDDPADRCEVMCWLADQLGVPRPARLEPGEPERDAPRSRTNKRCDNSRLHASGYRPSYPTYRDGYPQVIDAFFERSAR